jgi:transcriptional regulator with XRE-family HTH domain
MDETQPLRLRMLGAALRRYRTERGFSLDDAAAMLGCDRSKISRIETGTRGIRSRDLRDLLAEYGVSDSERDGLMALAGPRGTGGWQPEYADVLPRAAGEYLWLEAAASKIFVYEGQRVPPLLRPRATRGPSPSTIRSSRRAPRARSRTPWPHASGPSWAPISRSSSW